MYKDNNDLNKKVKYYLKNEEERKNIAKQGYEYTINNRTYTNTAQNILNIVNTKARRSV